MRVKRGMVETDWIISIGIFIIYLAWFFIVIRPVFDTQSKEPLYIEELKDKFMENASWSINATPLFVKSNLTQDNEPIIIDFPFKGNPVNYLLKDMYWVMDDGRLIFLASFPPSTNIYQLIYSSGNYTQPSINTSFEATEETAKSGQIQVNFDDGLIDTVRYRAALMIEKFSMEVNSRSINTDINNFSLNKIFAKYEIFDSGVNNTFYVFHNNTRIYSYINTNSDNSILLDLRLNKYDEYYVDGTHQGSIKYNVTACDSFDSDYIAFYDEYYGVSFIFSDDMAIEMCHNKNLSLEVTNDFNGSFNYRIIFHEKNIDPKELKHPYDAFFGAKNIVEGLSLEKLYYLKKNNYTYVKNEWGFTNDFNITISNSTSSIFTFGKQPSTDMDVESKKYNMWMLDKYANQSRVLLNILMW